MLIALLCAHQKQPMTCVKEWLVHENTCRKISLPKLHRYLRIIRASRFGWTALISSFRAIRNLSIMFRWFVVWLPSAKSMWRHSSLPTVMAAMVSQPSGMLFPECLVFTPATSLLTHSLLAVAETSNRKWPRSKVRDFSSLPRCRKALV